MRNNSDEKLYRKGLEKTRGSLWGRLRAVFGGRTEISEKDLEDVEDILIQSDVGVAYTSKMLQDLRRSMRGTQQCSLEDLKRFMVSWITDSTSMEVTGFVGLGSARPEVIMVVGVNGTGKTTTIGKLANRLRVDGRSVMLVAGDTYRAAAAEQLGIWADRSGARFVGGEQGGDPAAVVHDALSSAVSDRVDTVIIDTAGRLHTKEPLMNELRKIRRVASRLVEGAPHRVLLVLDAATGQNALVQARNFAESVNVTGLVITKMDGTAKGGILIPIMGELGIPVLYAGMGEGLEDLAPFDPVEYAKNMVGEWNGG